MNPNVNNINNNNINNFVQKNKNPIINQNINILYNNFNNYQNNLNSNNMYQNINNNDINKIDSKINPAEYIFERYGKLGWLCQDCNNFNFSSRVKCNKCGVKMKPIKVNNIQNEINFQQNNKKFKKNFIKKSGDWFCLNCSNINFAFRSECNRCHLSKQKTMQLLQQQSQMNERINNNTNNIQMNNIPTNNIPMNNIPTNNIPTNNMPTNNIPMNNIPMNNNNHILNQQMNQIIQNNLLNNQFNNNSNNNNLNQNNNNNDNISQIRNLLYLFQINNK
jgi:uncharacterized OB-fold protein